MAKKSPLYLAGLMALLVSLVLPAPLTLAQEELTETYVADDESFAFNYPEGWIIDEDQGFVYLLNAEADATASLVFIGPALTRQIIGGGANIELSETLDTLFTVFFQGVDATPEAIEIGERRGFRAEFSDTDVNGVALALEIGEGVGVILALTEGDDIEEVAALALTIAETFDVPSEGAASSAPEEAAAATVESLSDYAGDYEDAIAELQSVGLIPEGGDRIFEEDYAFFSGSGSWFTPLARTSPETNVVMAGELSLRQGSEDEIEFCTLTSRIVTDRAGDATTYLDVGLTTDGGLLVVDRSIEEADPTTLEFAELGLDISEPHHLLFMVIGEELTVYVDGQLVFDKLAVVERRGTYGISLIGRGPNALCEGRDIWAYAVASESTGEPIACTVSASINVNKRNGPGTNFNSPGALPAGEIALADGQATGAEGIPWWRLEDGSWVRSDLVSENGDCDLLPEVEDN